MQTMQEGFTAMPVRHASLISPPSTPVQGATGDWSNHSAEKSSQQDTQHDEALIQKSIAKRKSKKFIQAYARHVHTMQSAMDPCCHDSKRPSWRRCNDKPFRFNICPNPEPRPVSKPVMASIITLQPRIRNGSTEQIGDGSRRPGNSSCFMSDRHVTPESQKRNHSTIETSESNKTKKKMRPKSKSHDTKPATDKSHVFDKIDIDEEDTAFYAKDWIPSSAGLGRIPVKVAWKGSSLAIQRLPYYDRLHLIEADMASTLRLTPAQYLRCKRTLISTAQQFYQDQMTFRKSDAQKVCRVDVNKTSALWVAFEQLGWFIPNHT